MSVDTPTHSAAELFQDTQTLPNFLTKTAEFDSFDDAVSMVSPQETSKMEMCLKRIMDFILASVGLLAISPLMMLIVLAIRFSSPGPIIYKSKRIGKDAQPFYMYKFRTMIPNAHQLRQQLCEEAKLNDQLFKLKEDNRITPIGHFLRKYSLDELPQLLNVIRGEMSLVGPRPYIPEESALFKFPYTARFSVIPGMTGPWQVSGRSDLTFHQLCQLELNYVRHWSLWTDIVLLLKTIPCVLLKKGAY